MQRMFDFRDILFMFKRRFFLLSSTTFDDYRNLKQVLLFPKSFAIKNVIITFYAVVCRATMLSELTVFCFA